MRGNFSKPEPEPYKDKLLSELYRAKRRVTHILVKPGLDLFQPVFGKKSLHRAHNDHDKIDADKI